MTNRSSFLGPFWPLWGSRAPFQLFWIVTWSFALCWCCGCFSYNSCSPFFFLLQVKINFSMLRIFFVKSFPPLSSVRKNIFEATFATVSRQLWALWGGKVYSLYGLPFFGKIFISFSGTFIIAFFLAKNYFRKCDPNISILCIVVCGFAILAS